MAANISNLLFAMAGCGAPVSYAIVESKGDSPVAIEKPLPLSSSYEETVRRVLKEHPQGSFQEAEKSLLERRIEELEKETALIPALIKAMEESDISASIFSHSDYPYLALIALKQGKINPLQFATVQTYWSLKSASKTESLDVRAFRTDSRGQFDIEALDRLKTFLTKKHFREGKGFFTEAEFEAFLREIRDLPLTEQQFFTCHDESIQRALYSHRAEEGYLPNTIFDAIELAEVDLFGGKIGKMRVYLSFGLLQLALKVKFKDQAVTINPVIGDSTQKDIEENSKVGLRDVAIPFPGVLLPEKIHGHYAYGLDYAAHDILHSVITSAIPLSYRERFHITASDLFNPYLDTIIERFEAIYSKFQKTKSITEEEWLFGHPYIPFYKRGWRGIKYLRWNLIDMETYAFWDSIQNPKHEAFTNPAISFIYSVIQLFTCVTVDGYRFESLEEQTTILKDLKTIKTAVVPKSFIENYARLIAYNFAEEITLGQVLALEAYIDVYYRKAEMATKEKWKHISLRLEKERKLLFIHALKEELEKKKAIASSGIKA